MSATESFLVTQFREFYRELIRLKGQASRGEWVFSREGAVDNGEEEGGATAVWRTLLTLLERQSLTAQASGGDFAASLYRQAQYVMAALADEIFLHLDWGGREAWQARLLESKLFNSHRAGELIFDRLDSLLKTRDPVYLDLARIYLLALGLGFQGKYRGSAEGEAELAAYRRRLFRFLFNREPALGEGGEPLVPQAYAGIPAEGGRLQLPYLRPWWLAAGLLLVVWVAVSFPLWRSLVADLEEILLRMLAL